ncbi:MAG: NAD(P)/FAD-dependent oxidoreductase [Deltaproteobacteria bacterium]|nr:NAD(P)/FAD-dependent oxidoreductase [Deltaproteobacteria bacterium]
MPRDLDLVVRPDVALDPGALRAAASRAIGCRSEDVVELRILKRALDARRSVRYQLRVRAWLAGEVAVPEAAPALPTFPASRPGRPVVIVGGGPAGLFAALRLAEHGIPAVVLERGKAVRARRHDIALLNRAGLVNPESNYCFGEGGAGTYSDGKLYTRSQKRGSVATVLDHLIAHGADPEIRIEARPHVGSNRLPRIVTAIRETLARAGVAVEFEARLLDLLVRGTAIEAVRCADGRELAASAVVLAAGHSARDVHALAAAAGLELRAKPFALGIRVEHPQPLIDRAQYGADAERFPLPAASYRLTATVEERGVFSFCMCPGGWIVPATTEPDAVVVNGMSLARRDSPFANSGIVVALEPADVAALGFPGPTGGTMLQAAIERRAFASGGGAQVAPAQRLADFIGGRASADLPRCSYRPGVRPARLDELLPPFVTGRLRAALRGFGRQLRGFDTREAIVVGVETRSSSPVRILRDPTTFAAPARPNVYPCGEGAGYAGGIVSAALDGLAVADAIARVWRG